MAAGNARRSDAGYSSLFLFGLRWGALGSPFVAEESEIPADSGTTEISGALPAVFAQAAAIID